MDTRKENYTKQNIDLQFVGDDIINKHDQILDYKQAANDYRYMDSLIFYLVRKTQITYQMNDLYKQERAKIQNSVLPPVIGNQVHSSYIIPIYVSSIIILKLRKILTLQKAVGLFCVGTMYNEFIKFQSIRKLNEKLTQEYDEVSGGYSDFFSNDLQGYIQTNVQFGYRQNNFYK
ncbi:hypothetical protein pb186bvf_008498 [Paramecium bursaria]